MQHQLLLAIRGHGGHRPPTIGEVAEALLLRHHSAVELINRAQAAGVVERHRDTEDARVVRLTLTEKGETCLDQLTALHIAELGQLAPLLEHLTKGGGKLVHGPLG
jgi:DNA-binding MarR family transcriptional regulator